MKFLFFLLLTVLLCSCSKKTDSDFYSDAKDLEVKKNFSGAAELYEKIVRDYPQTSYAESSLTRLSVIYNNDLKEPRKALASYQRYYEMFPSSKQAPTMLFLAGFIYNNELHRLDSAKIIYETFLQKYPGHELAESAKFELETLGKDAGQFLTSGESSKNETKKLQN